MKQILLLVFLFGIANSFSQSKKFFHYFKDYSRLDASSDYPKNEKDPRAIFIPSRTFAGDTSGLKFNNEYVVFRQDDVMGSSDQIWHFRFMHTELKSVAEYREFQNYLRDSICRELLYVRVKDDKEAAKMLVISKQFITEMNQNKEDRPKDFGYKDRKDNREYFNLNWKYPLTPEKGWQAALLEDYYLSPSERFYDKREFDWRKTNYSYFLINLKEAAKKSDSVKRLRERLIIEYESPTIIHSFAWSYSSKSINDERSVLGQLYTDLFPNQPITGITGMQAVAFCDWKKQQIEKELAKQGFPCYVTVTLPTVSDLELLKKSKQQLEAPERNYTEQWRITVKEYKEFVKAVKDSLELELLYTYIPSDEDAAMLLNRPKNFHNDMESENVRFDPSKREQNRLFFSLKSDVSIVKKYKDLLHEVKSSGWKEHCYYQYFWMDAVAKGFEPKLTTGLENVLYTEHYETVKGQTVESCPYGALNELNQHSGVRIFSNLQAFIISEQLDVIQDISLNNQVENESMKGITYEQAKAFYSWKYPIQKAKPGDDWQQFVFPTKEQFESVQKGGTIVVPAHNLDFPTPTFHYVVHLSKNFYIDNTSKIKLR